MSPVVAGLIFMCWSSGRPGLVRALADRRMTCHIVFAVPGIVLATVFVTFPFVARELIPLMQTQGVTREKRRRDSMGPRAWKTFCQMTASEHQVGRSLRGVFCATLAAMGEFGAVSVVSGANPRPDQHHAAACRDPLQ